MGAVPSSEAVESSNASSASEQLRKALYLMMDPRSALNELTPDANLDIIYSNPYANQPSPDNPSSEVTTSNANVIGDVLVTLDEIPLADDSGDASQTITLSPERNSSAPVPIQLQPQDPVDVYMSLIAPAGLVRMLSSSSSASADRSHDEDSSLDSEGPISPLESV